MRENPRYGLYATKGLEHWVDYVHIESIPTRSSPNNWNIKRHSHKSFIQLLYLKKGGGQISFDDHFFTVKAPCILYIPEQIEHSFKFLPTVDGPVITAFQHVLEFVIDTIDPRMSSSIRKAFSIEFEEDDEALKTFEYFFDSIYKEFLSHNIGQPGICMSLLSALVIRIIQIRYSRGLNLDIGSTRKVQLVNKFRNMVDDYFRKHISIAEYSEKLGVTSGHLSRVCREVLGLSASAVINERLIYEARRDLVYTADAVKVIAWKLGFNDEVYFSRFFKKQTGHSPIHFREKTRSKMLVEQKSKYEQNQ